MQVFKNNQGIKDNKPITPEKNKESYQNII